jgi:subtilisin family serine protease
VDIMRKTTPLAVLGTTGLLALLASVLVAQSAAATTRRASTDPQVGINVVTRAPVTPAQRTQLADYGSIGQLMPHINGLTMSAHRSDLAAIAALPFVAAAAEDSLASVDTTDALAGPDSYAGGDSMWNLDMIGITSGPGPTRQIPQTGSGTYVAVLDTGLIPNWRSYLPEAQVDVVDAKAFGGGGRGGGAVVELPGKWQRDTYGHGTFVSSIVIGFRDQVGPFNAVSPDASLIPVKVALQSGHRAWRSVITRGIEYVAGLKRGKLAGHPVVINMSLASTLPDPLERAAIDDAISAGVIVVASAGNVGSAGVGYPAAYPEVISVGAVGWIGQWRVGATPDIGDWWFGEDVPDPASADDVYVGDYSSRDRGGQDLDVLAPGSWILGPKQNSTAGYGFGFRYGTSHSSPHVAGLVALMTQANPMLTAAEAEQALEQTALPIPAGCRADVLDPLLNLQPTTVCWTDAATGSGLVQAAPAIAEVAGR